MTAGDKLGAAVIAFFPAILFALLLEKVAGVPNWATTPATVLIGFGVYEVLVGRMRSLDRQADEAVEP